MAANKETTTTQKHSSFVSEPMGTKSVRDLPGIGERNGRRLENKGYHTASEVMGQFLVMKGDPNKFQPWLKHESGANQRQQKQTYDCLNEWTKNNM